MERTYHPHSSEEGPHYGHSTPGSSTGITSPRALSRRLGHPNPFTIGPAMDAIPCSVVAALLAFGLPCAEQRRGGLKRVELRSSAAERRTGTHISDFRRLIRVV